MQCAISKAPISELKVIYCVVCNVIKYLSQHLKTMYGRDLTFKNVKDELIHITIYDIKILAPLLINVSYYKTLNTLKN